MLQIPKLEELLHDTKEILVHHAEREKSKGEKFNIFSILKMESKENGTHSAFLGELLNPNGTHLKGSIFLELFLQVINEDNEEKALLKPQSAKVHLEYSIGRRDDKMKQGGRVDIFLTDNTNHISIENKIYAGDQNAQIERYHNYKKGKNTVFYLTLFGTEASKESRGKLVANEHYFTLSYKSHIIQWLTLCVDKAEDSPILKSSIQQYILLIKKLTFTMDNQSEKELIDVMLKYYEEASFIAANFVKTQASIGELVRKSVIGLLKERLSDTYIVSAGKPTNNLYSQIWIYLKGINGIFFGIESFSGLGHYDGDLFIGIFDNSKLNKKSYANKRVYKTKGKWINPNLLKAYDGYVMNLRNPATAQRLHTDNEFREAFIHHIVLEIEEYLSAETEPLLNFLKSK